MKKVIIFLFTIIVIEKTFGQVIIPKVDQRMELLSIVFRLADNPEYNQDNASKYVADIHAHFDKYKNDSLISFTKPLRENNSVSYDAVMSMAANLKFSDKTFTLKEGWEQTLDERWKNVNTTQFVYLLNAFYKTSKAEKFFADEQLYYHKTLIAFNGVISKFNQSWYYQYYGVKPNEQFNIIIDCSNIDENYSATTNSPGEGKQVYAIMGCWNFDKEGNAFLM